MTTSSSFTSLASTVVLTTLVACASAVQPAAKPSSPLASNAVPTRSDAHASAGGDVTTRASVPAVVPKLVPRESLPVEAREMLSLRMLRHGQQMFGLLRGVLLLDYELTNRVASDIAQAPKLGRPAPNERRTLNALLPAQFFVHQDALSESAERLAAAAGMESDERIVEAFGALAKTCVGCHSAYLHDDATLLEDQEGNDHLCDAEGHCQESKPASLQSGKYQ